MQVNALLLRGLAILGLLLPAGSGAQESGTPGTREQTEQRQGSRWTPSLSIIGGFTAQREDGKTQALFTAASNGAVSDVRPPTDGDDLSVTPLVGGRLELTSPDLPLPLKPRLFFGGEFGGLFGIDRTLAGEADPGQLKPPIPEGGNLSWDENAARGQGSEVVANMGTVFYGATIGLAFPFQAFGRAMWIKPAFVWMRYEVETDGKIVDLECYTSPPFRPFANQRLNTCNRTNDPLRPDSIQRETRLEASDNKWFDGIGPGLDLEMEVGRFGAIGASLFLGGRAYKVLGDTKIEMSASQDFVDEGGDLVAGQANGDFEVELDDWIYRADLGIRFSWLGSAM